MVAMVPMAAMAAMVAVMQMGVVCVWRQELRCVRALACGHCAVDSLSSPVTQSPYIICISGWRFLATSSSSEPSWIRMACASSSAVARQEGTRASVPCVEAEREVSKDVSRRRV